MLSVVVPVFNEQESLNLFYKELSKELRKIRQSFEIIFVDDGSTDKSLEELKEINRKSKRVRIFSFRKNRGKAEALNLGFQKARGDVIITLDADLQDKPSEIPKLLKKLNEDWDCISGWRKNRKDELLRVLSSRLANFVTSILWGTNIHDNNCGLKVYKKEAAKSLQLYGGMHRFIPSILSQQGFKVSEVEIQHEKRNYGRSKYGFLKLWRDVPDALTMLFLSRYSTRPLHFFGTVGILSLLSGFVILIYLSILHFQGEAIGNRPLLLLGILLILTGFQVLFTGFLADLFLHLSQRGNGKDKVLKYES